MSVFGVGFLRGEVVCRFGSQVMPVSGAAWLSSTHVTCTSPSSMRGTVAVEVSMNGGADFTGSGVEYMYEQGIRISGLRPSEGRADKGGQTVTVIGEGFPRAGGLSCWFGMHQRTRAYYVSDTAVLCTSTGMQAGTVMVRVTRDDDSGDGGGLPYHVLSSRAGVAGVRPTAGPTVGGTYVTLTGLLVDRSFTCGFGAAVVSGQVDRSGKTVCQAPAADSIGTVQVAVKQAGDEATFGYEYYEHPNIARVWPSRGDVGGGTVVNVQADGLRNGGVQCRFGAAGVVQGESIQYISSTLLACIAPAMDVKGKVQVDLSLNGGADYVKTGAEFMYDVAVELEELRPSRGLAGIAEGGQAVTITGQNFVHSEDLQCRFGLEGVVAAHFTSSSQIVCLAPERGEGVVRVSVSSNGVDFVSGALNFEYAHAGRVVSISPKKGPTSGATRVTVQGDKGHALGGSELTCVFGSVETGAIVEGDAIVCVSPRAAGVGAVQFLLRDKLSGKQLTGAASFEYYEGVSLTSLLPSSGSVTGGGIVTVIGAGLSADGLVCRFGENKVHDKVVHWLSSSSAACVAPPYADALGGMVEVDVSINGGADFTSAGVAFAYLAQATVTKLLPTAAVAGASGQLVTVVGQHFATDRLMCGFGKSELTQARVVSSTSLVCSVPSHSAATVALTIQSDGQEQGVGVHFEYEAAPVISHMSPSKGLVSGGTSVTVFGSKLPTEAGNVVVCSFGGAEAKASVVNSTALECTAPGNAQAGVVAFGVKRSREANLIGGVLQYEYYSAPIGEYIWPVKGTLAGGMLVSVHGRGLQQRASCADLAARAWAWRS